MAKKGKNKVVKADLLDEDDFLNAAIEEVKIENAAQDITEERIPEKTPTFIQFNKSLSECSKTVDSGTFTWETLLPTSYPYPVKIAKSNTKGRHVILNLENTEASGEKGNILLENMPIASVVSDQYIHAVCHRCMMVCEEQIFQCHNCKVTYYCSNECMASCQKVHAFECPMLVKFSGLQVEGATEAMRLLLQIIAFHLSKKTEIRDEDSTVVDSRDLFNDLESVLALENHIEQCKSENIEIIEETAKALLNIFKPYITSVGLNKLSVKDVVCIFLATQSNAHRILDVSERNIGLGLYPLGSMINHSCSPNSHHHFLTGIKAQAPLLQFQSITDIDNGTEICYNYTDVYQTKEERKEKLRSAYHFECSCERCIISQVYDENNIKMQSEDLMPVISELPFLCNASNFAVADFVINGGKCISSLNRCDGTCSTSGTNTGVCIKCKKSSIDADNIIDRNDYEVKIEAITNKLKVRLQNAMDIWCSPDSNHNSFLSLREILKTCLISSSTLLHPYHQLCYQIYLCLVRTCEILIDDGTNDETEDEMVSIKHDWVVFNLAALCCLEFCIGGNHPEIGEQYHKTAIALQKYPIKVIDENAVTEPKWDGNMILNEIENLLSSDTFNPIKLSTACLNKWKSILLVVYGTSDVRYHKVVTEIENFEKKEEEENSKETKKQQSSKKKKKKSNKKR